MIKALSVYCGSSSGNLPLYTELAVSLGKSLAQNGITLVYGGARVGLMGQVADAALSCGGQVIGVIPRFLVEKEIAHNKLSELHIVDTMHQRKALLAELADGFITMPGGSGSLEEFFEIWTASQLGIHKKPCGILNINHYYDHMLAFINHAVSAEFINPIYRDMLLVDDSPEKLLAKIACYQPPSLMKWTSLQEQIAEAV